MEINKLKINNIVCTINTKCKLDLKKIAVSAYNVEYKPHRFGALIMRIREPRSTALIFSSGKLVVAGIKSEYDAKIASKKFLKILNKFDYNVLLNDFKIQNVVCSYIMESLLSLEKCHVYTQNLSCYEPELFPGLILRIEQATLLVFGSGKVVITGLKSYGEVSRIFSKVYFILEKFKK
jgi:transcription initiation factor TFIID TATA-box-binding protein